MQYDICVISDLHLLSRKTEAENLRNFLKHNTFNKLYLLGDIVDLWRIQSLGLIPNNLAKQHIGCFQQLLKHIKNGTEVHYIYGNHDRDIRTVFNEHSHFGNLFFHDEMILEIGDKKVLLIHGDQFDTSAIASEFLGKFGDFFYELLITINRKWNKTFNTKFSLANYLKKHTKTAIQIIGGYEYAAGHYAKMKKCDTIICGHIHTPTHKTLANGVEYINTGCWTDSSTCSFVTFKDNVWNLHLKYQDNIV